MIAALREWLTGVVAVAVLLYLVRCLLPQSAVRRAADFTGGLIFLAALLQPLSQLSRTAQLPDYDAWRQEIEARQEELEELQQEELSAVIAQRTAAYISHEADALGLDLEVFVETRSGEDGVAVPCAAVVTGPYSEALAAIMAQDLGIPRERQVWHERED